MGKLGTLCISQSEKDKAIALLKELVARNSAVLDRDGDSTLHSKASLVTAYVQAERLEEAIMLGKDVCLLPKNKQEADVVIIRRCPGQLAAAYEKAGRLAARWSEDAGAIYDCACVHALAAGSVKDDAALAERYAARAVALLQQAVAAGYKNGQHLLKESDVDALRHREDFQMLLKKLNAKQP